MKMLTFSRKVRGIERIERNSAHTVADRAPALRRKDASGHLGEWRTPMLYSLWRVF